jgi:4-amino-4-deoxy-L-arabinose transferase-like glycosyltransferase
MDAAQLQISTSEAVIFIAVAQVALWTIIPALSFNNAPLDVIENIAWGQEWQLGYYKHPPLQAWLTSLVFQPTGQAWLIYLSSQLSVVICFWCIWELGRDVADERGRLLAVMFFSLLYYANIPTPEFNANVLQMPIWAAAMVALWRAINSQKLGWWLVLGVVMALSVYAKYSFTVLVMALAAALLSVPQGRVALKRPGLYVSIALTSILIAPHMVWLFKSDFLPFSWATARAEHVEGLSRITSVLKFLLAQLADHIGSLALLAVGAVGRVAWLQYRQRDGERSAAERYVISGVAPRPLAAQHHTSRSARCSLVPRRMATRPSSYGRSRPQVFSHSGRRLRCVGRSVSRSGLSR